MLAAGATFSLVVNCDNKELHLLYTQLLPQGEEIDQIAYYLDCCLGALAGSERPASHLQRRRLRVLGRASDLCYRR